MADFIIPPPPTIPPVPPIAPKNCKWCKRLHYERDSLFCSVNCRLKYNSSLERKQNRPKCAIDDCSSRVRTQRAMYCKEHTPKRIKLKPTVSAQQPIPPGNYECYWCNKKLKPHQVRMNAMNEDFADRSPGNIVTCCDLHHKGKQRAMAFLDNLSVEKFNEFGNLITSYRQRYNYNR